MFTRIFIRHSSIDQNAASKLVALLRAAFLLDADDIGCSSSVSAEQPDPVRCDLLVALVSPASAASDRIASEMESLRSRKPFLASIALDGLEPTALGEAANCSARGWDDAEMFQLIVDLSEPLDMFPASPELYDAELQAFSRAAATAEASDTREYNEAFNESLDVWGSSRTSGHQVAFNATTTWRDLFGAVSRHLSEPLNRHWIEQHIAKLCTPRQAERHSIDEDIFAFIETRLEELQLIKLNRDERGHVMWELTPLGQAMKEILLSGST